MATTPMTMSIPSKPTSPSISTSTPPLMSSDPQSTTHNNSARKRSMPAVTSTHTISNNDDTINDVKRIKKPVLPYQIFVSENRHKAIESDIYDLGLQNKYLSELYKSISDEEKQRYQDMYDTACIEYDIAVAQQNKLAAVAEQSMSLQIVQQNPLHSQIPLPRVKKLMYV